MPMAKSCARTGGSCRTWRFWSTRATIRPKPEPRHPTGGLIATVVAGRSRRTVSKSTRPRRRTESAEPIDWISYHHEQIWRQGDRVARRSGPILDDLAYNQNESRELSTVPDVILSCQLESAGKGDVYLRANDGRKEFEVRLDLAGRRGEVREADRVAARFDLPGSMRLDRPCAIAFALADCRLQLVVSGVPIVDYRYDPADSASRQPTAKPLAIGAVGMPLRVTHWVVSRDIYYLPPRREAGDGKSATGAKRILVVGGQHRGFRRQPDLARPARDDARRTGGQNSPLALGSRGI